jgi:hypothetical protein
MEPGFHCRFAHAKHLRGLGYIEVLHVSQNEDLTVDVWHLA